MSRDIWNIVGVTSACCPGRMGNLWLLCRAGQTGLARNFSAPYKPGLVSLHPCWAAVTLEVLLTTSPEAGWHRDMVTIQGVCFHDTGLWKKYTAFPRETHQFCAGYHTCSVLLIGRWYNPGSPMTNWFIFFTYLFIYIFFLPSLLYRLKAEDLYHV